MSNPTQSPDNEPSDLYNYASQRFFTVKEKRELLAFYQVDIERCKRVVEKHEFKLKSEKERLSREWRDQCHKNGNPGAKKKRKK